jgi:hypothetical protein
MTLTRQQRKKLYNALVSAFPNQPALGRMVAFELDEKLEVIAQGEDLGDTVFKLIQVVEASGHVPELIAGALMDHQGNVLLREIAAELGVQGTETSTSTSVVQRGIAAPATDPIEILIREKPDAWQPRLFAQVLADQLAARSDLRRLQRLEIARGPRTTIQAADMFEWVTATLAELGELLKAAVTLVNRGLDEALKSGDAEGIVFVARHLGAIYEDIITWSQQIRRIQTIPAWQDFLQEVAKFADPTLDNIDALIPQLNQQIEYALSELDAGRSVNIQSKLVLRSSDTAPLYAALERTRHEIGSSSLGFY